MFCARPEVEEAIRTIAEAPRLTLIVGAGVSAEAGLPTWNSLVTSLLERVADELSPDVAERGQLVEWILETEGLPGAGSIVQAVLGENFIPALRECLYGGATAEDLLPGPTANQVARLLRHAGRGSEVLTTNYDLLLEQALRSQGVPAKRIKRYVVRKKPPDPDLFVFRHLHGVLTADSQQGQTIVLSDADYFRMQTPNRWQERHTKERLEESACLFLGTSLSDPNLVRYVYRSDPSESNTVVFARQGDSRSFTLARATRAAREEAARRRWNEGGVRTLYADYFSEVAQFVYEVALARASYSLGMTYRSFRTRIDAWWAETKDGLLDDSDVDTFRSLQDALQLQLAQWLDGVRTLLNEHGCTPSTTERLGLHLWILDPKSNALILWASSDRSWRDPLTMTPVKIERPTPWIAIESYCRGTPVVQSTEDDASSRWNHVLSVPLRLDSEPEAAAIGADSWGLLPVGAITLASTEHEATSVIGRLPDRSRDELTQLLASVGTDLLAP